MTADEGPDGPRLVAVVRDGAVESVHRAVVAVSDADGRLLAEAGDVATWVYPRSAVKPAQAAACLDALADAGLRVELDAAAVAIGTASHAGTDDQQIEAARLLALADLDESALRCPPAAPAAGGETTRLAHNCSGKHALFLLATATLGADPSDYLSPQAPVQQTVRRRLGDLAGEEPAGPGVDGCGAPAWRVSVRGLARLAARLAAAERDGDPRLAHVAASMRDRPELVGGEDAADTALMRAGPGVVAKRGAEGVLIAGLAGSEGADGSDGSPDSVGDAIGVAVKVVDGAARATGPLVAEVLASYGMRVPQLVRRPAVLGGGRNHGSVSTTEAVAPLLGSHRSSRAEGR